MYKIKIVQISKHENTLLKRLLAYKTKRVLKILTTVLLLFTSLLFKAASHNKHRYIFKITH